MSDDIDLDWLWGGALLPKETAKPKPDPLPAGTNDVLDSFMGYELIVSKPAVEEGPRCECGGQAAEIINNLHKDYCPVFGKVTLREDQK